MKNIQQASQEEFLALTFIEKILTFSGYDVTIIIIAEVISCYKS